MTATAAATADRRLCEAQQRNRGVKDSPLYLHRLLLLTAIAAPALDALLPYSSTLRLLPAALPASNFDQKQEAEGSTATVPNVIQDSVKLRVSTTSAVPHSQPSQRWQLHIILTEASGQSRLATV
jgi:hypothetical protein